MGAEAERAARREVWEMLKGGATADEAVESLVESGWPEESAHDIAVRSVTSRWNWGGFGFGVIWLLGNRCWLAAVVLFVAWATVSGSAASAAFRIVDAAAGQTPVPEHVSEQLNALLAITARGLLLIAHLVVGYMGGRWSWRARKYISIEHFRQTQNVWADFVIVFAALSAAMIVAEGLLVGWGPTLAKHFVH